MDFFEVIQFDNYKTNREIKIGILAIFANVFVGLTRFIVGIPATLSGDLALNFLLIILQTISFALLVIFGIGLIYLGKLFDNQTGIWAGITFIIVHVVTYISVYLGIYPIWAAIDFFNAAFTFLLMFILIFFFLLNISKKYEEPIILATAVIWIVVNITIMLLILFLGGISIIVLPIPLMIRDFFTAWAFAIIITREEKSERKDKFDNDDYKHVKVTYDSDD